MKIPYVFLYSGHGTQYFGMGKVLYETEPEFRRHFDEANVKSRDFFKNASLVEVVFSNPGVGAQFSQTLYTHPALFVTQWSLTKLLESKGFLPQAVLGTSLGEVIAAHTAAAGDTEDFLNRLCEESQFIENNCREGSMLAILAEPQIFGKHPEIFRTLNLAGINMPKNFVVSGDKKDLELAEEDLTKMGITVARLPVKHAFHSTLIEPYLNFIRERQSLTQFPDFQIPLWSTAAVGPLQRLSVEHIIKIIRDPIQLMAGILALEQTGPYHYIDLSPTGTMGTALKYLLPPESKSKYSIIMTQMGNTAKNWQKFLDSNYILGSR